MKKILLTILLTICNIVLYAQKTQDVLYLKNGSVIHGIVLETIPDEHIKLRTNSGDILVFKIEEIQKVEKQENAKEKKEKTPHLEWYKNPPHNGYKGFVEIGAGPSLYDYSFTRLTISTTQGYQFNKYMFAGAGFTYVQGLTNEERYKYKNEYITFADVRFDTGMTNSAFADFKFGYSFLCKDIHWATTIGYRRGLNERFGLNIGVSFEFFRSRVRHYEPEHILLLNHHSRNIMVKVGFDW